MPAPPATNDAGFNHEEDLMGKRDTLIAWLNDAHAMETQLIPVLRNHAKDARDNPPIQQRIEQHISETEQHAQRVRQAVERLGTSPSNVKSTLATLMGTVQSVSTGIFSDELVKNALADYASEQFEVASYKALIAGAEELGEAEVARLCRENLREDEDMARFFDQQLPTIVHERLQDTAAGGRPA
jgi:ferritin-like metal-binding protein YciE